MRFTFVVAAALPLLARLTSTLAQPISLESDELATRYADDDLEVRDSGFDFPGDFSLREIDDYLDAILEARAKGAPYAVKTKKKVSAADQKARKDAVRTKVANNQANNAAKKKHLQAQTVPKYGKPRSASKQKPNQPGYRAKGRAAGVRLPKQPKTPKPNMKKGDPRSAKSQAKQAAANKRTKDRKAAGVAKFADAKAKYKKTTSMPNRKATFTANGKTVTGKDVRTAVFNSHHFQGNGKGKPAPKQFNNHEQGPAHNRHKPLPKMKGPGQEFPVNNKKGGYQGGGDVGGMRVITQAKQKGGRSFKGVVAHDASRDSSHPGYNDHHQVKAKKNK